eukprot:sb/3477746/
MLHVHSVLPFLLWTHWGHIEDILGAIRQRLSRSRRTAAAREQAREYDRLRHLPSQLPSAIRQWLSRSRKSATECYQEENVTDNADANVFGRANQRLLIAIRNVVQG